jgi:signal transduction histidine kinase
MLREERDADPALQRELEVIAGAADRAATLTRRLLTFGRQGDAEPADIQLADVVRENVDLVRSACDPRIACTVDAGDHLPPVRQVPGDVHQVVLNLLLNARDTLHDKLERHPDAEASVLVRVEPLSPEVARELPSRPAAGQRITVQDTGLGIERDVLDRIFEPFFTTKEVGRGTGLGLATVWHVVQACGGRVVVDSTPGAGTTFHVDFPQHAVPRPWREPRVADPSQPEPSMPGASLVPGR